MTWTGRPTAPGDTSSTTTHNWSNSGRRFYLGQPGSSGRFHFLGIPPGHHRRRHDPVIAHGLNFSATGYSISSGSLTVTSGGIVTSESVTISSDVYIGAPQSWNVAAGKTLSITGPLHTIISDLTFSGAGTTTISNTIDGGGVLNTVGGAKPGGLIQAGTGVVTLSGITQFSGDITANSGVLNIQPPVHSFRHVQRRFFRHSRHDQHQLFRRVYLGRHRIDVRRHPQYAASRHAHVRAGGRRDEHVHRRHQHHRADRSGRPRKNHSLRKFLLFHGADDRQRNACSRDVVNPTLLADNFSVGGGTLEFNTVNVDTNYTGVVSGSGCLSKSGPKKLTISGSTGNAYTGDTNLADGFVDLNKTAGYAIPGNLNISGINQPIFVRLLGENQIAPSATVSFHGPRYNFFELLGHALTVTGLFDTTCSSFVENCETETGNYSTSVLTIDGGRIRPSTDVCATMAAMETANSPWSRTDRAP